MTEQSISVSAPGKLFILGEHAVVYDGSAIVTAVDARVVVTMQRTEERIIAINAPDINLNNWQTSFDEAVSHPIGTEHPSSFIAACVTVFHRLFPIESGGVRFETRAEFNPEYGIGSSAAVVAATLYGLTQLFDKPQHLRELFNLGLEAIRLAQNKVGSGADLAAALFGGTVYYINDAKRSIAPLDLSKLPIFAVWSGTKEKTPGLVNGVRQLYEEYPYIIPPIIEIMLQVVEDGRSALEVQQWQQLGKTLNIQHGLLHALQVDTHALANIVGASLEHGALGAKLSGAGGGDCAIVLTHPDDFKTIQKKMTSDGFHVLDYAVHADGVRLES